MLDTRSKHGSPRLTVIGSGEIDPVAEAMRPEPRRKVPEQPRKLRDPDARRVWRSFVVNHDLGESQLVLLAQACTLIDRAAAARRVVDAEGLTMSRGTGAVAPRPEVEIERVSYLHSQRLLQQLEKSLENRGSARERRMRSN